MKNIMICVAIIEVMAISAFGQDGRVDAILSQDLRVVSVYEVDTLYESLLIPLDYGESESKQLERIDSLLNRIVGNNGYVFQIDLVYTNHPVGANLSKLNGRRLSLLMKGLARTDYSEAIPIQVVRQDAGLTRRAAEKLFHGFVVYYITGGMLSHRIWAHEAPTAEDSIILKIAQRNNWVGDSMLVVVDLSGSMEKAMGMVMLWLREHLKNGKGMNLVLFNDKDYHITQREGAGGGIVFRRVDSYLEAIKLVSESLESRRVDYGNRTSEENDIEGILKGLAAFPNSKELILIADSNAPPHDMILLEYVKRPIKIITPAMKNTDSFMEYAEIAMKTKGSIHTLEADLVHLKDMKEGDQFLLSGKIYKCINGKLVKYKDIKKQF